MTPGSNEAVAHGCLCSPVRNNYGLGLSLRGSDGCSARPQFERLFSCPIHGCTCLADWRSGERVRNPGCNIHGDPTPKEDATP